MSGHHLSDEELIKKGMNTARYFTENRAVAWVLLIACMAWGVFAFIKMPKAKDPAIPVRVALAICPWPGASAEKIEQLVTPRIEAKIAENPKLERIESTTRSSVTILTIVVKEGIDDVPKEFDDIKLKLDGIKDLPEGAGPITFLKDFGDTATVLLTVASPKVNEVEVALRARGMREALVKARAARPPVPRGAPASLVLSFPPTLDDASLVRLVEDTSRELVNIGAVEDARVLHGVGYVAIDAATQLDDEALISAAMGYARNRNRLSEIHPDVWRPVVIRDPATTKEKLTAVAGDRYSYRELDQFTETLQRHLLEVPLVARITRSGVLPEAIYLDYSQEKLASYGIQPLALADILAQRNITAPGGISEIQGRNVAIDPSGSLEQQSDLGSMLVSTSSSGMPVYLRDLVDVRRDYQNPPRYLNYVSVRNKEGKFERVRGISLAILMRPGTQIADFGAQLDTRLDDVKRLMPEDLIIRRTSDQPLQVRENISLFMSSLYEAILLVVLVGLIGFWEWRSALLLALSIPITLAMTFGLMQLMGIDIQQVSIASLILALGLLVDDPVVAGDAIKSSLDDGWKPRVAAWLGPTKLATAILFATVTNIVAYLPMLGLTGDVGKFIFSLPLVITASLIASRLVSMSFIPLLGFTFLRQTKKSKAGPGAIARAYRTAIAWTIPNRGKVLAGAIIVLLAGFASATKLKMAFFPTDLSYLSYVDVWLPEDAPLSATREVTRQADLIIQEVAAEYAKEHPGEDGKPRDVLTAVTTFVGGGAPRFWFSVPPEQSQLNYAQLIIHVSDRHDTSHLVPLVQEALSKRIPGALLDVRQLENGKPVGIPISVRVWGDDPIVLRGLAEKVKALFRSLPTCDRVRDDWGAETFSVKLEVDPDRANLAGVTNLDVARSSASAMSGRPVGQLREGDRQIPIITRLRAEERAQLEDIENLYVTSSKSLQKVPLRQISHIDYKLQTEKIRRRNQFRTVTVSAFPVPGVIASQVIKQASAQLEAMSKSMPPGYQLVIGGEQEARKAGFGQLAVVMLISVLAIFLALVIQFKSVVKPLVVFATIPFGVAGALVSLVVTGAPFGFMAFLGIVSLIGVIVSHMIVKFEFIEEQHQKGSPLQQALIDAGTGRLRPVLITVGATVLGLVPLALHGGPLWEPLCYAQMGGLMVATVLTLFLVPVLYTVAVRDLKLIQWERPASTTAMDHQRVVDPSDEATRLKPRAPVTKFEPRSAPPVPSGSLPKAEPHKPVLPPPPRDLRVPPAPETRVDVRSAEEDDESTQMLPKDEDEDDEKTVRDDRKTKRKG